jgi:tetratricopeptide (TPR) repeat protein
MAKRRHQKAHPAPKPPRGHAAIYWAMATVAAAVCDYLNALGNDFVLDDIRLIRDNVRIRSLAGIPHLFVSSYWGVSGAQALYRPLVLASYALNYATSGLTASGYILVNITLHAAVSLLLFALVRAIGGSLLAAGIAGIAFAVHPVHTEAVAGMSGRPELLAALFFLVALHLHRRAAAGGAWSPYRLGGFASFGCALLSKESAMTFVLVAPVMDALVPASRADGTPATPRTRVWRDYVPLLAVAVAYLAVRRAVLGGIVIADSAIAPLDNPIVPLAPMPFGPPLGATRAQALMTACATVLQYARLLVWPARLSPDYSFNQIPIVTSALDLRFAAGVTLIVVCLAALVALWRRSPMAAFGLAFLVLTFAIVSNVAITIGTICAERLVYLPSAGLLIAASVGVDRLIGEVPVRRKTVFAALALVAVAAAARTWTRNRDWKDESTLWSAAIAVAPASARVQSEYGRLLMTRAEQEAGAGRTADAERLYTDARAHFETAIAIYPSYSLPLDGLAMIESLHDRFDEANALYARALTAWPGNYASLTNWASLLWDHSRTLGARASALRQQGRIAESDALVRQADDGFQQAVQKIDRATAMMPSYVHAHLVRALILDSYVRDVDGAAAEFETVLRLEPNHPQRALIESELQRLRHR